MKKVRFFLYQLLIIVSPLIVLVKKMPVTQGDLRWQSGTTILEGFQIDYFNYYKGILVFICGALLLITLIKERYYKKKDRYTFMVFILLGISVMSCLMSPYKEISLLGINGRYEGFLAEFGYYLILLSSIYFFREKIYRSKVEKYLYIGSSIVFIIGFFQFFNVNIYKNDLILQIISKFDMNIIKSVIVDFNGMIYSTHSNPNYIGTYAAMIFLLSLGSYISSKDAKTYLYGGFSLLAFINLIGSQSRAGLVGLQVGLLAIVFLYNKHILKDIKKVVALGIICTLTWFGMNIYKGGNLETFESFNREEISDIYGIEIDGNSLKIDGRYPLEVVVKKDITLFLDGNKNTLLDIVDDKVYPINDRRYPNYQVKVKDIEGERVFAINYGKGYWKFKYAIDGSFYMSEGNKYYKLRNIDRVKLLDKYQNKGSKRVYIWSRSIPKLLDRPLVGWGQDTYPLIFPQDDYFGKKIFFGRTNIVVDKAHNYFIQLGINNGLITLGIMLIFLGMYIIESIGYYFKNPKSRGLFIFIATLGYLSTMLFNDSVVSVAPTYWVLVAMNISIISRRSS